VQHHSDKLFIYVLRTYSRHDEGQQRLCSPETTWHAANNETLRNRYFVPLLVMMRVNRVCDLQILRRNDETLRIVTITERWEAIEILGALQQNTVAKYFVLQLPPLTEEMYEKLSEVLEYNKSVDDLGVFLGNSNTAPVNLSLNGLAPILSRLKKIRFSGADLTSQQIGELCEGAADCKSLEKFGYARAVSIDVFKAICQLCSRFPSLKWVCTVYPMDLYQNSRFTAVLEMLKTSKTIERVDTGRFYDAEQESAIKYHCHKNMIHNRIALVRQKGILTAKLPNSAWPMILKKFSDVPDVIYYLLQQKHGTMFGPVHHGRKRKQEFD
jgi:hypothetical protein